MTSYSTLIFDLDGTLADPALGFVRCMNYALTQFGYSPLPDHEITCHIGPPLESTIQKLLGSEDHAHIDALTVVYRERYAEFGYLENEVYPGIVEMLTALSIAGIHMGVCTSKLHTNAIKVLEAFELRQYFDFVCGATRKMVKAEQLAQLKNDGTISADAIMIGDRSVDLIAAHNNGLYSAGVMWGYGNLEELSAESPTYLFKTPEELVQTLILE